MPHAIRVPPRAGEPAYEAFERLAARLGDDDGVRLARALGIDRKAVRHGSRLDELAGLLGMDPRAMAAATFVRDAHGMRLGGFSLPFRGWAPSKRVCIRCLVGDAEADGAEPALWRYRRTWWDLRAVGRCERHGCALIDGCPNCGAPIAWRERTPRFCASCGSDLVDTSGDAATDAAWEAYLVGRLGFGPIRPSMALDALSSTDALSCVLAIGETLSPRATARRSPTWDHAYAVLGFGLLQDGGAALGAELAAIETPSPHLDRVRLRRLLNPLLDWLEAHPTEAVRPIRDALLSHVRSAWIVPAGLYLLGEVVSPERGDRRIALECRLGLDRTILDRLLRHAGVEVAAGHECGADEVARLKALIDGSVTLPEAKRILDLDTRTLRALERIGILPPVPWAEGEAARIRFERGALERLAARLRFDVPALHRRTADQMTFDEVSRALRGGSRHDDRARTISSLLGGKLRPCARFARGEGPMRLLFDAQAIEDFRDADARASGR
ncbi:MULTISPECIES: TniQ family protein [unclassified Methylobacterium]|jgi:hypothetical protein|uniref:TniQ family protein n=1 Tax=unclassified Methylobacterium TaxID=2615210 RepID=UPI00068E2752|nr:MULTISPECIES: TniQ family protein [unclassified Methylobacterium]